MKSNKDGNTNDGNTDNRVIQRNLEKRHRSIVEIIHYDLEGPVRVDHSGGGTECVIGHVAPSQCCPASHKIGRKLTIIRISCILLEFLEEGD